MEGSVGEDFVERLALEIEGNGFVPTGFGGVSEGEGTVAG